MKISSINIENFKSITKIEVTNLPDFIVLVGENGIGKSSIFDSISFVKSHIGPYSPQDVNWWNNRILLQNPIKTGESKMKIEFEIEPTTNEEKRFTGNSNAKAGIKLELVNGEITIEKTDEGNAGTLLRSWRKQQGVGAIEMIPAQRTFPEGAVQLASINEDVEQIFSERTSNLQNKYRNAKQYFVNYAAHDSIKKDDPQVFPQVKQLVETLLGRRVKIDFDSNLMPSIQVESLGGYVNIDTLSSGQREVFMTYVGIHSTKLSNSIILFDEPDLHLHASLQKEVLRYLKNLSNSGNQVFLATHSLEMISETSEENLFHLTEYKGQSQLKKLEDEKEKLEIFRKLGASKYTFVNFKKIVFLEGQSDYLIFHKATPSEYSLRYEQIGGISKLTPEILDDASKVESFYMIKDRDFLDNSEITSQETKYHDKVKFLRRRHIENYILDSDEFFEIYQKHGDGQFSTKDDLVKEIYRISELQQEQTIADYYLSKHGENANPPQVSLTSGETAEKGLTNVLKTKEGRLTNTINKIPNDVSAIRTVLQTNWKNDWLIYSSGKNILKAFTASHISNKSMEDIRDLVSVKWDEKKYLPNDIDTILKQIAQN